MATSSNRRRPSESPLQWSAGPLRPPLLLLLCALLVLTAGCATGGSTAMDYRTDARRALEAGHLQEAGAMAELARERAAEDPATRRLLARIERADARRAAGAGDLDRAFEGYREAAELTPDATRRIDDLEAAVRIGDKAGMRPSELAPLAQTIVEARPDSAQARRRAARLWDDAGEADKALPSYRWLWKRNPEDIQIGNRLGALLKQRDRLDAAAEVYRAVLQYDDTNVQASINLAAILTEQDQTQQARALFERLLKAYPDKPSILLRYARFLARQGETERARALKKRAYEKMPGVEEREMRNLR